MIYSEISVKTTSEASEVVAYFLQEVCMDGISIYDRNDLYADASWDYKDDSAESNYVDEVVVKGYCAVSDTETAVAFLRGKLAALSDAGSLTVTVSSVDGDMWVAKFRETFRPIETDKIVICP